MQQPFINKANNSVLQPRSTPLPSLQNGPNPPNKVTRPPGQRRCTRHTGSARGQAFRPVQLSISINGVAGWRGDQSPRVYLFWGSLVVSTVKVALPATPPVGERLLLEPS